MRITSYEMNDVSTDPTSNRPTRMAAESVSTWVPLAVLIAAVFPFILTLTYFHLLANAGRLAQFLAYTPGKVFAVRLSHRVHGHR